jgi:hypothetical protein
MEVGDCKVAQDEAEPETNGAGADPEPQTDRETCVFDN